jgi:hypothetical protein
VSARDFWRPFESVVRNYVELAGIIDEVFRKWEPGEKVFAWRGQVDADRPLHSSLYRRLALTNGGPPPEERELYSQEHDILAEVHRWGLHVSREGGRLSILGQLAALQHFGAPTRLIDITFNPWIATWFAVEEKWEKGVLRHQEDDARLFAIDVTGRLINEVPAYRGWEDSLSRPWPSEPDRKVRRETRRRVRRWCTKVLAWRPPHYNSRIAAQNGGFIFGGVPMSQGPDRGVQWPTTPGPQPDWWRIADVRRATSVALRPHLLRTQRGGVSRDAVYTIRIEGAAKSEIRARLERNFGYKHSTIYPDFTGFASFATPRLRT